MNDDTPMCGRHEANYIQLEGYQNRNSYDSCFHQSHHDLNDSEKSFTELNNDVRNNLEDFKSCIRSMRTVHDKLFDRDNQSKTDLKKSITKFLDSQRFLNMFVKNNVNDIIIKMKQNEKNCQIIYRNMERKIDEWLKSQNVSLEQTGRTDPPPPPAQTEQVNVVFTESGKSDDSSKIQEDPPPPIIGFPPTIMILGISVISTYVHAKTSALHHMRSCSFLLKLVGSCFPMTTVCSGCLSLTIILSFASTQFFLTCVMMTNKESNITVSNSYATLEDESDKDVENVYDETANLFSSTKIGESSSFTVAVG
ncbi:hypothetical protein Tco_0822819 [Tanacetum coccineum]|uniref:Uncharacterized protein n=1 Tax=Tanacetum coccineum TaxID=301880 RepID=A0ABQ5AG66_9ASTR